MEGLRLLYVGSILPPIYDLTPLMEIATTLGASLMVCCPAVQWEEARRYYAPVYSGQIKVVHGHGGQLGAYYAEADLFAVIRTPHRYVDFMMPVKVFEALGHGLPIATLAGTEVARFVDEEGIGWVAANIDELRDLLLQLQLHPDRVREKKQQVEQVRKQHTWLSRAQSAADILMQVRASERTGSPASGRAPRPVARSE
jgi:glycosyltransferase involved in cell wall biosynthesis